MSIDFRELISSSDPMLIFVVMTLGLLLGKLSFKGIQLGATTGILIVAIVFGDLGFKVTPISHSLGFMLFIFCVGIEAGPNFFNSFRQDGLKYVILALSVAVSGVAVLVVLVNLLNIDAGLGSGILAGALTSTPTLVGAQDTVINRLALPANEQSAFLSQISVGYAIAYLVGMIGVMIVIQVLPRVLKINLVEEAKKAARERSITSHTRSVRTPIIRAYEITAELQQQFAGRTLRELGFQEKYGILIESVKRDGKLFDPDSETVLQTGDAVALVGYPINHTRQREFTLPHEVFDPELLDFRITTLDIVVSTGFAKGKTIEALNLQADYGCFLEAVTRSQINMPVNKQFVLSAGDILTVSGEEGRLNRLATKIGFVDKKSEVTDLVSFGAFFICGLFLGYFSFRVGRFDIGLGSAGGLLFAGILMGYYRAQMPTFGSVPQSALNILKSLGLNFFMVSIGLSAGESFFSAIMQIGLVAILMSAIIMMAPVILAYFIGHKILKMNPALLLGAITGSMTSTPALELLNSASQSSIPSLGYAGSYAFANVFLAVAGATVVMVL
ncbi:putative transport protein [Alteromonadaceae bacterium 2753L.S.0a.02]|nr:putative transport protein [Alteromonadaceae bacterium 2753L.S.0a.02]